MEGSPPRVVPLIEMQRFAAHRFVVLNTCICKALVSTNANVLGVSETEWAILQETMYEVGKLCSKMGMNSTFRQVKKIHACIGVTCSPESVQS